MPRQGPASAPRDAILAIVHDEEGINKTELRHRLGLGWGTVCYHVARLERDRVVQTFHRGRDALLFPRARSPQHMGFVAVSRRPAVQRILGLLRDRPEVTVAAVLHCADLSRFVVNACLADMEAVGLVVRFGRGRARYRAPGPTWDVERAVHPTSLPLAAASVA